MNSPSLAPNLVPFFDGHNDALLRLFKRKGPDAPRAFLDSEGNRVGMLEPAPGM